MESRDEPNKTERNKILFSIQDKDEQKQFHMYKVTVPVLSQLESLADKDKSSFRRSCEAKRTPTMVWDGRLDNFEDLLPGHVTEIFRAHDGEHALIQSVSSTKHLSESFEDLISDEENWVLSRSSSNPRVSEAHKSLHLKTEYQDGACSRSIVQKIHDLATSHEKTDNNPVTSEAYEIRIGNKGKKKFKSLLGHESVEHSYEDDPIETELFGNTQKDGDKLSIEVASHGQSVVTSIAELLENLQQQDEPSLRHSGLLPQNMRGKNKNKLLARRRILPQLGNKNLENEEDHLEHSGSEMLCKDEDNNQNQFSAAIQKITGQTMTDLFQGAFSHSEVVETPTIFKSKNLNRTGYNRRLQRVLQNEKDRNLEFSKYLQTGTMLLKNVPPDFSGSLVVQVLSRHLEAKLTVCQCLFAEQSNGVNQIIDNAEEKKWIIFSSKICDNVELDVGKFIRIYPPWKEVWVKEDENVMLCLFFRQERLNY